MERSAVGDTKESIAFSGRLFEVTHLEQPDGRIFEIARRAPGVRLIIADNEQQKILLTREFRRELDTWDYRLPGGKVFDSLDEYRDFRNSRGDIVQAARQKAVEEGREEAGVIAEGLELVKKSTLGATVEWDLYIFEVTKWQEADSQSLEDGEQIETGNWFSFDEVEKMILASDMQEERVALALLQYIKRRKESI